MLKIRAEQDTAIDDDGWCRLIVDDLPWRPDGRIELSFRQSGKEKPHLGEQGWQASAAWLPFDDVRADGTATIVRVGPWLTSQLGDVRIVEIAARAPDAPADAAHRARVPWPHMRLATGANPGLPPPLPEAVQPVEEEPVLLPVEAIVAPPVADPAERALVERPPEPRRRWLPWLIIACIAVIGGLAAAYHFLGWPPTWPRQANKPPEATTAPPAVPAKPPAASPAAPARTYTEDDVHRFLGANPTAPDADAEAQAYVANGHPDFALQIYRYADRKDDPAAAKAIARWYDPQTYDKATSPFPAPDADRAAEYYEKSAKAGDVESQFALGRLFVRGKTSGDSDVERGVVWLERAAKAGSADAAKLLEEVSHKSGGGN